MRVLNKMLMMTTLSLCYRRVNSVGRYSYIREGRHIFLNRALLRLNPALSGRRRQTTPTALLEAFTAWVAIFPVGLKPRRPPASNRTDMQTAGHWVTGSIVLSGSGHGSVCHWVTGSTVLSGSGHGSVCQTRGLTRYFSDETRMCANAQRDGCPAEYSWRPLFNAAKFGWRPLLECRAVTKPRSETR